MTKRPQILERAGKPAFAILPIEDYQAMRQRLEDLEDLALLREAEQASGDSPGRPLSDVLAELGLQATSAKGTKTTRKHRARQPARRGSHAGG